MRAVLIFPLEFIEARKDVANTGAHQPTGQGKKKKREKYFLDELKRKNRDWGTPILFWWECAAGLAKVLPFNY